MSLRIAATRLTELHTVKRMTGGNGGVIPPSYSQTLNVCDITSLRNVEGERKGGIYSSFPFSFYIIERVLYSNPNRRESVVSLVGLTR